MSEQVKFSQTCSAPLYYTGLELRHFQENTDQHAGMLTVPGTLHSYSQPRVWWERGEKTEMAES